jgi:hypothetical protein
MYAVAVAAYSAMHVTYDRRIVTTAPSVETVKSFI